MRRPNPAAARSAPRIAPNGREVAPEAIECAREAGLRYVSDQSPGLTRRRAGTGWHYFGPDGRRVSSAGEIARIDRLAIPPAWTDVWICPSPNGHLQATGRDQRGRKQYRYHADWRATRDATKYERMTAFARALPKIRRRVAADLKRPGLGRDKVLAAMVRLLESTHIRVGNDEYARANKSYGLSTLRNRHVRVRGGRIAFDFTGKSGRRHAIDLRDPRLAGIVARLQDLPGQELFGFVTEDGRVVDVKSDDVNAYLRAAAGGDFSAKDFRTWAGTVLATLALAGAAATPEHRHTKKHLADVVKRVAERLGNTPAVCRRCYIHPAVPEAYLAGEVVPLVNGAGEVFSPRATALGVAEKAVLAFLEKKAKTPSPSLTEQLERSVSGTAFSRSNYDRARERRSTEPTEVGPTSASRGCAARRRSVAATRRLGRDPRASRSRGGRVRRDAIPPERRRAAAR